MLLLDHEPSDDEIRRIQAQANRSEELALTDQQEQFRDCWQARAGLPDDDRIAAVCADLGISARRAHNLLRQLTLPEPIRSRVAERPGGEQLSVTMANKLADMHEIAPELTLAVADRITTADLHETALRDLGAFVHRTVVENEHTYAIRIDDGALLDGGDQIEQARAHLTPAAQEQAARMLGCEARRARGRARRAGRPRQAQGAQDPRRRRAARPRPHRPLRLRPRARPRLRRRHLGHRPGLHARRRTRAPRARRRPPGPPRDVLLRRPARRRRAARRRRSRTDSAAPNSERDTPRRSAPTSGSGTTSAPASSTRPTRNCTR